MGDNEPEEAWPVKGIVAENQSKKQYKIEWEGIDPETNEPWRPTWEPYECVSSQLRSEWEARKRMREERDLRKEHKRKLRALDIQQQKLERGRFPTWNHDERDSSRSASPQNSHQRRSASSDESAPLRSPKKPIVASMSPQRDMSPPLVPTRKRKRTSQPDSDPSYRPTQTTHTQSTENTRDTLYSSNISAASVDALKSTQDQLAAKKNRRKSAPSGDAASATAHTEARRRSLPANSQDVEEDVTWPDTRPAAEDPRAAKKKLRAGAPVTNGRDIPVKAKRRRRNNDSPVDYRLPEAEEAEVSPPVEEEEDEEEQPMADEQEDLNDEPSLDDNIGDGLDVGIEDGPFPYDDYQENAEPEEAVDGDEAPILQSLLRRGASSSEDERGRIIVSSASRKRKQNGAPELPESLRYNGASRSEEIITRGEDADNASGQTRQAARVYRSDSGHQSEEADLPPPLSTKKRGAQKKAKNLKKAGSRSDPERTHEEVAQALSEQAALPKFRRRRAESVEADEPVNPREGTSRRSYEDTGDLDPDGWPVRRPTTSQEGEDDSTHIVPDSQSLARSPARPAAPFEDYVPYNVDVPPAPAEEAYDPRDARMTSAGPSRKAVRRSVGPPGSRLASANVEKPLKKVRPPEPTVFKPYLPAHSPSQDTIHQFSSQDARPQLNDGTHEAVREVIERSVASRKGGPRAEAPSVAGPSSTRASMRQEQEIPDDNDIDMAYNEFNNVMDQYLMESTGGTGAAGELEELGIALSSGMAPVSKEPLDRPATPSSQPASMLGEVDLGALRQQKEQRQNVSPAPPTVVDRKISNKELGKLIKTSGLPSDTKDELAILLEAPDYYKSCGRALTSETQWSFKLGQIPEESVEGDLNLLVSMEEPSWVLQEHRAAQIPDDDLDDSAALAKLRTEIASLKARSAAQKATIEDQTLQIARTKAETMDIQVLYGRAIVAIERHEIEKATLRLQNDELKAQLSTGLAQIQLIETAAKDKLRSEYERIQRELQMAHEMARLTGDHVIRAKAARTDELERMEKERLLNQRKMMEAARAREEARRQAEAIAMAQEQQQQNIGRNAFINAKMGDGSSSDDQNFQAGSSGSSSDEETDSDDDDEQLLATASEQLAAIAQAGMALLPPGADAVHLSVPLAVAIEEGVIPGGLAAISPAMSPLPSDAAAAVTDEQQDPALPVTNILETAALLAVAAAAEDTSGETTEQTTTITSHSNPTDSQKLDTLNTSSENIVEILVMDSEELPSMKAYMCRWDAGNVEPCSFKCGSRQALYLHLEAVHALDAEAPFADENTGMLLPP